MSVSIRMVLLASALACCLGISDFPADEAPLPPAQEEPIEMVMAPQEDESGSLETSGESSGTIVTTQRVVKREKSRRVTLPADLQYNLVLGSLSPTLLPKAGLRFPSSVSGPLGGEVSKVSEGATRSVYRSSRVVVGSLDFHFINSLVGQEVRNSYVLHATQNRDKNLVGLFGQGEGTAHRFSRYSTVPAHKYPFKNRWCTEYVAHQYHITWGGNAGEWLENARRKNYATGKIPLKYSIVVTTEGEEYGHVAIVEDISYDRQGKPKTLTLSESNFPDRGRFKFGRKLDADSSRIKGYIYTVGEYVKFRL
jgi:surface antigen